MARLLLMLACARVAAGVMDALDIKAVCEVPTDGGPRKIYLDMDAEAFETLAGPPGPGNSMSLPIETSDCEPFKSAYINFSPGGHPAWDGKGDGYGIDHFDIHFFTITEDARVALMGMCLCGNQPVRWVHTTTLSSRRRVDGVEDDATIQHE